MARAEGEREARHSMSDIRVAVGGRSSTHRHEVEPLLELNGAIMVHVEALEDDCCSDYILPKDPEEREQPIQLVAIYIV